MASPDEDQSVLQFLQNAHANVNEVEVEVIQAVETQLQNLPASSISDASN